MKKEKKSGGFASAVIIISLMYLFGSKLEKMEVQNPEEVPYQVTNLSINSTDMDTMVKELENEFAVTVEDDKKDEFLLLYSIFDNDNLDDNVKKIFYGYYSIILDNPYLNREEAYRSLSKVNVKSDFRGEEVAENVQGLYEYQNHTIHLYTIDDVSHSVLYHEGIHCMFTNPKTINLPTYFTEGTTELLVNEYFSYDPFYEVVHYPYEVAYVKMLNELVGTDRVLKAFSTGDFTLVSGEIQKYNTTPYSALKILNIYEDVFYCSDQKANCSYTNEEKENAYRYLGEIYKKMHPAGENEKEFQYFYELSHTAFGDNPSLSYAEYIMNHGVLEKAYFSSNLKKQYSNGIVKNAYERDKVYVRSFSSQFDK